MSESPATAPPAAPPSAPTRGVWLSALPVLVFAALAGLFIVALGSGDPGRLPSALIGKPVPAFTLPGVPDLKSAGAPVPGFATADFRPGQVTVVNVWASWCVPCVREHPQLVALSQRGDVHLYGINYKDKASAARRFLNRHGNPFNRVGADPDGRVSVEWGLTGVPETFVIDHTGRIAFKYVGELTRVVLDEILIPEITKAKDPANAPSDASG